MTTILATVRTPAATFAVVESAAAMPSSCWGRYSRVAVVELRPEATDADLRRLTISERSRAVASIVAVWERLHVGGERSARAVAVRAARDLVDDLVRGGANAVALAA